MLLKTGIDFPFTHNLQALIDLLPAALRASIPPETVDLTPYAVTTRYPGEIEPVTEEEHLGALRTAESVVAWAESVLGNQRMPGSC